MRGNPTVEDLGILPPFAGLIPRKPRNHFPALHKEILARSLALLSDSSFLTNNRGNNGVIDHNTLSDRRTPIRSICLSEIKAPLGAGVLHVAALLISSSLRTPAWTRALLGLLGPDPVSDLNACYPPLKHIPPVLFSLRLLSHILALNMA